MNLALPPDAHFSIRYTHVAFGNIKVLMKLCVKTSVVSHSTALLGSVVSLLFNDDHTSLCTQGLAWEVEGGFKTKNLPCCEYGYVSDTTQYHPASD